MREHIIPAAADGMALAQYVRRAYPMCDEAMLRRALSRRDFRLDGARAGGGSVKGGAVMRCYIADEYLLGRPFETLFRDESMAAIVKPQGISCQRDAQGIGEDTVEARAAEMFGGGARLVNRLDHYTGGVMPVALTQAAYDEMLAAFSGREVEKTYVCQVAGAPREAAKRVVSYGAKDARQGLLRVSDEPQPGALYMALSYETIARGEVSLLRVRLETGRTHQIRAQLAHIGLPVLGDDKYGDRAANRRFGAAYQRLWCESIEFTAGSHSGLRFYAPAPFSSL